jgi:hypothetical protein
MSGEAVALALGNTYWTRPLGMVLLQYPIVTSFLTHATLAIEIGVPFLLLVPYRIAQLRVLTVLSFWGLQLGLGTALELNFFPVMSTLATLVLLPSALWDGTLWRSGAPRAGTADVRVAWSIPFARHAGELFVAGCVAVSALMNTGIVSDSTIVRIDRWTGFFQGWNPYSPSPPLQDIHPVLIGNRAGRPSADLWLDDLGDEWKEVQAVLSHYRIKQLLETAVRVADRRRPMIVQPALIAWLCDEWTRRRPDEPLQSIAIFGKARPSRSRGQGEFTRWLVLERRCPLVQ